MIARLLPRLADYAGLGRSWRRDIVAGATVGVVALPWRWRSESVPGWARRPAWSPRWSRAWSRPYSAARTSRCPAPPARWQSSLHPSSSLHYGVGSVALVTILAGLLVLAAGASGLGRAVTFIRGR